MHILELSFSEWLKFTAHKSCPCIRIICFACSIFESSLESKHQYLWKICHSATLLFLNLTHYHSKNLSHSKVLCFLISALKYNHSATLQIVALWHDLDGRCQSFNTWEQNPNARRMGIVHQGTNLHRYYHTVNRGVAWIFRQQGLQVISVGTDFELLSFFNMTILHYTKITYVRYSNSPHKAKFSWFW